jgi:O-antigen ligase/polysaccharide polymerase Wzy-like membrane protein
VYSGAGPLPGVLPRIGGGPHRYAGTRSLPEWPLYVMFGLVPVWWVAGAFYAVWPVFGALLLALLALRGRVRLPAGTGCWVVFCALAALSAVQVRQGTELLSAVFRMSFYLTALVAGVYAYTVAGERGRLNLGPLGLFWGWLVVLGWVGVVAPHLAFTTPVEAALPGGLGGTAFVHDMVQATATELRSTGASTLRPSAPFPYTNLWGSCYALLLPCVLAFLASAPRGWVRRAVLVSLPVSLVPAFLTLNRGMFVSLGAVLLYVAVRALRQGRPRLLAGAAALVAAGLALTWVIPLGTLITDRTAASDSTGDRISLYDQVLQRIWHSPLLGFGAPTTVDTTSAPAPVGTQGQLWLVLYSYGIPALLVLLAWFAIVIRAGLRVRSPAGLWLSAVPVAALVQLPFYGLTFQNLTILFVASGIALAAAREPAPRYRVAVAA